MSDNFGSFKWLTGDVNYVDHGGRWYRKVGERNYHVIELCNWAEVTGQDANEGKYNVTLCEVDVSAIAEPKIYRGNPLEDALRSCGWEIVKNGDIEQPYDGTVIAEAAAPFFDLVCLEALHGYGNKAYISDLYGNNWRKLMRQAISESRACDPKKEPEAHEAAMNKPVNALSTTARDYMLGNIFKKDT